MTPWFFGNQLASLFFFFFFFFLYKLHTGLFSARLSCIWLDTYKFEPPHCISKWCSFDIRWALMLMNVMVVCSAVFCNLWAYVEVKISSHAFFIPFCWILVSIQTFRLNQLPSESLWHVRKHSQAYSICIISSFPVMDLYLVIVFVLTQINSFQLQSHVNNVSWSTVLCKSLSALRFFLSLNFSTPNIHVK